jgi:hypothetical protein
VTLAEIRPFLLPFPGRFQARVMLEPTVVPLAVIFKAFLALKTQFWSIWVEKRLRNG